MTQPGFLGLFRVALTPLSWFMFTDTLQALSMVMLSRVRHARSREVR